MRLTNKCGYPDAYVKLATGHNFQPKPDRIGVTQLIKSPQIRRLCLERWEDIVLDVDDMFNAILGTAFHKELEGNYPEGKKAEQKWESIIAGLTLVGKADLSNGGIEDYKLTSAWSYVFDGKKEWAEQLNVLNWLRVQAGSEPAKFLTVHAFFKDWSEYNALKSQDYPSARYIPVDIPLWALDETRAYINRRISLHKDSSYKCTDEDKWIKLEKWAVQHRGKDRADKLCDTAQEANDYIMMRKWEHSFASGEVIITQRKSEPKNCTSYCIARSVCPYAQSL